MGHSEYLYLVDQPIIETPFHEGESEDCFRFAHSVVERSGTLVPPPLPLLSKENDIEQGPFRPHFIDSASPWWRWRWGGRVWRLYIFVGLVSHC